MSKVMQKLMKRKMKGFTLIEMVIVVLLVGIMAAIAIPKFLNLTDSAKQASYDTGLGSMKSAVAIYLGNTQGNWPAADSLSAAMEGSVTCFGSGGNTYITLGDIEGTYSLSVYCATVLTNMGQITGPQTWL